MPVLDFKAMPVLDLDAMPVLDIEEARVADAFERLEEMIEEVVADDLKWLTE